MDVSWSQLKSAGAAFDKTEQPQIIAGQPQDRPQGFDFVGAVTQGLVMTCEFVGHPQRLGEHWKTTPQEAEGLARAIDDVLPDDFAVGKWGALMIAAGAFIAPRAIVTAMNKNKPQQPQQQKTAAAAVPAITQQPKPQIKPAQAVSSRNK